MADSDFRFLLNSCPSGLLVSTRIGPIGVYSAVDPIGSSDCDSSRHIF